MSKTPEPALPLFYRKPQPLVPVIHDDVRLVEGDFGFAAETNATPLAIIEFAAAMRHYPIVFSEADHFPIAVLGLGRDNRFVTDGRWAKRHYVPAYVRRYPFVFAEASTDRFALALDVASERVVQGGSAGLALFEDGKPTALTEGAMAFCREFHAAHVQTRAFVDALGALDLLVAQQADAKLGNGEPLQLCGFRVIDAQKFAGLDDAVILDWHKKGWLALVHFHLASLDRFADLLVLESASAAAPDTGTGAEASVEPALEPAP